MDNVVSLNGAPVQSREMCDDIARTLDDLAQMARDGEIAGVLVAIGYADGATSQIWEGRLGHAMIGALEDVKYQALAALIESRG